MKRVILLSMIFCLIFLTSCSRKGLENAYFENTTENTFEEAYTLFFQYIDRVRSNMEEYYPRGSQDAAMYLEDTYLASELMSKDQVYRHEFYNYHLSDDRSFMRASQLYYVTDETFSFGFSPSESCGTLKEGENCVVSERDADNFLNKHGITFFMEDEELYIDFMFTVNKTRLFHYVFYFYQDEQLGDVMEMTLHISDTSEVSFETMSYTKLVFDKSNEEYLCNNCDPNDATAGSLEYRYADFKDKPYQTSAYESGNIRSFIHLFVNENSIYGDVFDGVTGELFNCSTLASAYETRRYAEYIRNTLVVSYSPTQYTINLQEVLGWDNLVKLEDESNLYQLQYQEDVLSNQYFVKIQHEQGEYPYFSSSSSPTEDMISLNIFGLQTPYTTDYFNEKFDLGTTLFAQTLDNRNINNDYSENYANFMVSINKFKES